MNKWTHCLLYLTFVGFFLFLSTFSYSQNGFRVSGTVTDASGQPVQSVTVQEKGTSNSTQTKQDGTFQLTVASGNAVLVLSAIGFDRKEVSVNNKATTVVSLVTAANALEDVVVVGYGTRKRTDVTGAISSVNSEQIRQVPTPNISQALQGRIPGLVATQSSFRPGSGANIRIRGNRSLTANNAPSYVVDSIKLAIENSLD